MKMNPLVSQQICPSKATLPFFRARQFLVAVIAIFFVVGCLIISFNFDPFIANIRNYAIQTNHPAANKTAPAYALVDESSKSLYYKAPITSTQKFRNVTSGTNQSNQSRDLRPEPDVKTKLILFYNRPSWWPLDICKFGTDECPVKSCICSDNGERLAEADVVIIDIVSLRDPRPPKRYPQQVWISFGLEAPPYYDSHLHTSKQWRHDVFNWTMTYRLDSDVVMPYSMLIRLEDVPKRNFTEIALRKSKSAAWMASNCRTPSKRDVYVKMLKEYYPVDVYGACGSLKISRNKDSEFMTLLNNTYRFYLAFENSLCKDYITEKLFKTFDVDIVAVVRGGADYSSMIPAGTYINTADFASPRKLADYLEYLEGNVTAYSEILRRKSQYVIAKSVNLPPERKAAYCDICTKLNHINKYTKVYSDTDTWLRNGTCHPPRDL